MNLTDSESVTKKVFCSLLLFRHQLIQPVVSVLGCMHKHALMTYVQIYIDEYNYRTYMLVLCAIL